MQRSALRGVTKETIIGTITMVRPEKDRWFFNEVGEGAQTRAEAAGLTIVLRRISVGTGGSAHAADCIDQAFEADDSLGAVVAGFQHHGGGTERFFGWKRPVVIIGGSSVGWPVVSFDDVGVGRAATKHLLDLRHTRIARVTGPMALDRAFVFMCRRARDTG